MLYPIIRSDLYVLILDRINIDMIYKKSARLITEEEERMESAESNAAIGVARLGHKVGRFSKLGQEVEAS